MGLGRVSARSVMVILAILFWLSAVGLTYVSVKVFLTYETYEDVTKSRYALIPASIILGAAVVIFLTGLIGFCGACKENKLLLGIYFTLILLILLLEIIAAILGYVYHEQIKAAVRVGMDAAIQNYTNEKYTHSVDIIQSELKCCGVDNYTDWEDTAYYLKNETVPTSCCKNKTQCTGSLKNDEDKRQLYQEGCFFTLFDVLQDKLKYIAVAGGALTLILLNGLLFACVLLCSRKEVSYMSIQEEYEA